MSKNSRYVFGVMLAEMLVLPIGLTLILLLIGPLFHMSQDDYTVQFVNWCAAFVGALLAGAGFGMLFSAVKRRKPESPAIRYAPLLAPALYALGFAVFAYGMSGRNFTSQYWGVYVWKSPAYLVADAFLSLSGHIHLIPVIEVNACAGFAGGYILQELISKKSLAGPLSAYMKTAAAAVIAACLIYNGVVNRDIITGGLAELRYGEATIGKELTEYDLSAKAPFTPHNGLAVLDHEASLQFTELADMPKLDGATAAYPVYAAFAQAVYKGLGDYYRANETGAQPRELFVSSEAFPYSIVKCSKTQQAYENLMNGKADVIFAAEPSEAQTERVKWRGDEFDLTPIGSEAFVFFTNVHNPVENLSVQQIQGIYSGRITNWRDAGGPDKGILAYQRPEDSGSQTIMQNKVMQGIPMMEPTVRTRAGGMGEVIRQVADYRNARNAIGYTFLYYSSSMVKDNRIKYIAVDHVPPMAETVRSRTYPFTIPVYAVTLKSNRSPNTAKLLDWILSAEGQRLIELTGYVPVKQP